MRVVPDTELNEARSANTKEWLVPKFVIVISSSPAGFGFGEPKPD